MRSTAVLYFATASCVARSLSNLEMSAPETKALPPAPVMTMTRTALSATKSRRIASAASHISSDTALWRSGLLKVITPIAPRFSASILSVGMSRAPSGVSDRLRGARRGDLGIAEAELAQHRVGVRAGGGRRAGGATRRARQLDRLADHARAADRLGDAEMRDLRVGEHLVDRVDRSARHAGLVEAPDPLRRRLAGEPALDLAVEPVAVGRARGRVGEGRVGEQVVGIDRLAEALPDRLAGGGDVDVAVAGAKHAGRDRGRVVVARLLRHLALHQPARGLEVEHEDLRLQQRGLHPLSLARALALEQRDQHAVRAEQ